MTDRHMSRWPTDSHNATVTLVSERRSELRGGRLGEPPRRRLVALILGTYAEMPGLSIQLHQAARLFGLRQHTCLVVLSDLVGDGWLQLTEDGHYRSATTDDP
jgi:hypothetical protein